jgi:hypothetical protein
VSTTRPLTSELRALLAGFAGLALIAGFLLFPLAEETDRFFSWDIAPPLTAAFLGAAYWAAFVLIGWSARRDTWEEVLPALLPVTVIAAGLLAATLIHLDKFDLDSLFGWFWLVVYCLVLPVLALLVRRQLAVAPQPRPLGATPVPVLLRATLLLQTVVMAVIGVILWVSPSSAADVWPWTLTPLTGRAVGTFLIGFAAAGLFAALDNKAERLRGSAYAYAVLGALELLAALIFGEHFDDGEAGVYVTFAASVLLVGLAGSALARGPQRG